MGASPAKVGDRRLERLESILRSLTYLFIGFDLFKRQSERKAGRKRLRGWGGQGEARQTSQQTVSYQPTPPVFAKLRLVRPTAGVGNLIQ